MIATVDFTAFLNGRAYEFKKGERVEVAPLLIEALKKQGVIAAPTKRKATND